MSAEGTDLVQDYSWIYSPDIEDLLSWIDEQKEQMMDPNETLKQLENKVVGLQQEKLHVAVVDFFSSSHPWWNAVCTFYGCTPNEMGRVKDQRLSPHLLRRWNALQ